MHSWFELMEKLEDFFNKKYNGDIPQIKEITGYISGGGSDIYHINPFGSNTLQLIESDIISTGIRAGDIIVYKNKIERLEKI